MVRSKELILTEKISSFQRDLSAPITGDTSDLESQFKDLKSNILEQGLEKKYCLSMNCFDRKLNDIKKETLHRDEIEKLEGARKDLECRVLDIQIPIIKNLGNRFDVLRQDAAVLEEKINKHGDNCYAIANLRQSVQDIKVKIENLSEDNKIFLSWTGVTTVLTGASIGVAFIPVVGLPIAAGMAAVPYLGKLAHRLAVSYKRKKIFTS